jgi:hypothetical protein
MNKAGTSITAILVVEDDPPTRETLSRLSDLLASLAADSEILVLANGVSAATTVALRGHADHLCDLTVHFLAERIDRDTATLVGIDHSLGDWVWILSDPEHNIAHLPRAFAAAGAYDIVFAGTPSLDAVPFGYRILARAFFLAYRAVTGTVVDWPAPRIRIYSRAAARYLTSRLDGEIQLRSLDVSGAFPGTRLGLPDLEESRPRLPAPTVAMRKAFRALLNASSLPLRATIGVSVLGAAFACLTSIYAVSVYLVRDDVAPGWTTLSLQLSGMMFIFALMFGLTAEYVLRLYRVSQPRRKLSIVREMRSPHRRDAGRLNVVSGDGSYRLGAPPDVSAFKTATRREVGP